MRGREGSKKAYYLSHWILVHLLSAKSIASSAGFPSPTSAPISLRRRQRQVSQGVAGTEGKVLGGYKRGAGRQRARCSWSRARRRRARGRLDGGDQRGVYPFCSASFAAIVSSKAATSSDRKRLSDDDSVQISTKLLSCISSPTTFSDQREYHFFLLAGWTAWWAKWTLSVRPPRFCDMAATSFGRF
jgi:hypothetical protein